MSKPKPIESIRNAQDAEKYAHAQGWEVQHGKRHDLIVSSKGKCAIPRHNGDFCTGTRWAIIKTLAAMSIAAVLIWQFVQI